MSRALVVKAAEKDENVWYCHCCTASNAMDNRKCRVCGRDESYGLGGYPLPFHGDHAKCYRPSQILNVMQDIHASDGENWTALHVASANGNLDLMRELLKYKTQIEALTSKGHTALHLAVHSGSAECVSELVRHKAKVNVATYCEKQTPLHMACEKGLAKIAQILIQAGAIVDARNIMERTPLHCVAVVGRSDIALLLLRAGAELKALDVHGWDPCQIAELFNNRELQELLIREGMTEKQAVITDLPPAPWHSDIWFEVVKAQTKSKREYGRIQRAQRVEEEKMERILEEARMEKLAERQRTRQLELRLYKSSKAAYEVSR
eukprot:gene5724-6308_t